MNLKYSKLGKKVDIRTQLNLFNIRYCPNVDFIITLIYWTAFIEFNQVDFLKISVLSFHFLCVSVCLCMMNFPSPYMGMAEEEEGKRGGGGWPCARRRSPIAIFHFGIVMSFWALIILAPPPSAIK